MQLDIRRVWIGVTAQMDPQRLFLVESLLAMGTDVRFLTGVGQQVPVEDFFLCKTFLAHFALKRSLPRVDPFVPNHCTAGWEPFFTNSTRKAPLGHVDWGVSSQLDTPSKSFRTVRTLEYFQLPFIVHLNITSKKISALFLNVFATKTHARIRKITSLPQLHSQAVFPVVLCRLQSLAP